MADVVLFGAGQVAEVAKAYLDRFSEDRVVGFTVDAAFLDRDLFCGLPLVAWEHLEETFPASSVKLLGPLSYQALNGLRRSRHHEGKMRGYDFATFIHPSTYNLAASVGENCFILENCTLQPFVRIGDGVIIWSSTHIGHHSTIGDFCFISSQVGVASGVTIKDCALIGGQVGIDNGLIIGEESYLESRVILRRDVAPGGVVRHPHDSPKPYSSRRLKGMRFR